MYNPDFIPHPPVSELDILNDERDSLIAEIAELQEEKASVEELIDAAQIALHDIDLAIKSLQKP